MVTRKFRGPKVGPSGRRTSIERSGRSPALSKRSTTRMRSPAPLASSATVRISVWRLMNRKPGPSGWTQPVVKDANAQSASGRRIRKRVPLIKMQRFYRGRGCGSKPGNGSIDWEFQFLAATISVALASRRLLALPHLATAGKMPALYHSRIKANHTHRNQLRPPRENKKSPRRLTRALLDSETWLLFCRVVLFVVNLFGKLVLLIVHGGLVGGG